LLCNAIVILSLVGAKAAGAILDPIGGIRKITAAPFSKGIKRTVAEQTAEAAFILHLVTGEILTLPVLEKIIT
jgi:hypothetical protein